MNISEYKSITVLGAGYVGLTTAALLSNAGFTVFIVEPNKERLDAIKAGKSFFYEFGLDSLIKSALTHNTLIPTDDYAEAVRNSSVIFSCVGTPDNEDGSSNLTYVFDAARSVARNTTGNITFVQKSTVPVGTGNKIIETFKSEDTNIRYVSNPEFLREGTAIFDTLYFDRVILGGDTKGAIEVEEIYKQLEIYRDDIANRISIQQSDIQGIYTHTTLESAELIKVTSNAFLALKISFANSIAKLSDAVGADINEVMDGVGADARIGRAFLNAGRGYGGGCFPKDVSGLLASASNVGVNLSIMEAAQNINTSMPHYIIDKLQKNYAQILDGRSITNLGLSFKPGTSDTRKSPGIKISNLLANMNAIVSVFDPKANHEAKPDLNQKITIANSIDDATANAEVLVISTDWPEFSNIDFEKLSKSGLKVVVDSVNMLNPITVKDLGLTYIGVGR